MKNTASHRETHNITQLFSRIKNDCEESFVEL